MLVPNCHYAPAHRRLRYSCHIVEPEGMEDKEDKVAYHHNARFEAMFGGGLNLYGRHFSFDQRAQTTIYYVDAPPCATGFTHHQYGTIATAILMALGQDPSYLNMDVPSARELYLNYQSAGFPSAEPINHLVLSDVLLAMVAFPHLHLEADTVKYSFSDGMATGCSLWALAKWFARRPDETKGYCAAMVIKKETDGRVINKRFKSMAKRRSCVHIPYVVSDATSWVSFRYYTWHGVLDVFEQAFTHLMPSVLVLGDQVNAIRESGAPMPKGMFNCVRIILEYAMVDVVEPGWWMMPQSSGLPVPLGRTPSPYRLQQAWQAQGFSFCSSFFSVFDPIPYTRNVRALFGFLFQRLGRDVTLYILEKFDPFRVCQYSCRDFFGCESASKAVPAMGTPFKRLSKRARKFSLLGALSTHILSDEEGDLQMEYATTEEIEDSSPTF
jgi:hypothetical protein